jgi:hypothetical protein
MHLFTCLRKWFTFFQHLVHSFHYLGTPLVGFVCKPFGRSFSRIETINLSVSCLTSPCLDIAVRPNGKYDHIFRSSIHTCSFPSNISPTLYSLPSTPFSLLPPPPPSHGFHARITHIRSYPSSGEVYFALKCYNVVLFQTSFRASELLF